MNEEILKKIIKGETITKEDIVNELYEMCDDVHASCDNCCLIYDLNNRIPTRGVNGNCIYFKNGEKILSKLKKELQ